MIDTTQWSSLWLPPERLPLSQWCEQNLYISSSYAPRTGPVKLYAYQRAIFDSFTDPRVSEIVLMCGTQLTKTLFIQGALAYTIAEEPSPCLIVEPTDTDAKDFSKERLSPMLRDCPVLRGKVSDSERGTKANNDTLQTKLFPGGSVSIVGAGAPGNLARRSIARLFCDEVDKYKNGVEGDVISLGLERTINFGSRRKLVLCCSPTNEDSRIAKAYEETDQREPWVPCHACGRFQVLNWAQVKWDNTLPAEERPATSHYECAECGAFWSNVQRLAACEKVEWRAKKPFVGKAGFWINHLYSPWKSLAYMVGDFLKKKGKPAELQTFLNCSLAQLWTTRGEAPPYRAILDRCEHYPARKVPRGALFVTAGVDCQVNRLECQVRAWGRGGESWLLDYIVLDGNTAEGQPVWDRLTEVLNTQYEHESSVMMPIVRLGLDTGYQTNACYQWVRSKGFGRALALDPRDGKMTAIIGQPAAVDVSIGGHKMKRGLQIWPVNTWLLKSELYQSLRLDPPTEEEKLNGIPYPNGYHHFTSQCCDDEFFKQLVAEELVTKMVKGFAKTAWSKTRDRNEALDTFVYARAAAAVWGLDRMTPEKWDNLEMQLTGAKKAPAAAAPAPVTPQSPRQMPPPRRSDWLERRTDWLR